MKQILFYSRQGKVGYWKLQRGRLSPASVNGMRWGDGSPAYWDAWKSANQVVSGDDIDALILSDDTNGLPSIPEWLRGSQQRKSNWTMEDLSLIAADPEFAGRKVEIAQGEVKTIIGLAEGEPLLVYLQAMQEFTLPKEPPKPSKVQVRIVADCLVDEKSKVIKTGDVITATVNAFSKFRGCFLDTEVAGDQLRVLPEECQKDATVAAILEQPGTTITAEVGEISERDGLIVLVLLIDS